MFTYTSVRNQSCPNTSCSFHNKTDGQNVLVHGKDPPRLRCKACGKTWVTHKNHPYYGLQSESETIEEVLKLLALGLSIRRIAVRTKLSPSTVQRWKNKFINNH